MHKNFFKPGTSKALLKRLDNLSEIAKPKWGILTPVQLLKHLQLENDLALGHYHGKDHSNLFREWAFKLVIKGKMPLPTIFSKMRMVQAIPELDVVKSKIVCGNFSEEKDKLLTQFDAILHAKNLAKIHPAIGKMNMEEWGCFYAWHTEYHLKQFGI